MVIKVIVSSSKIISN